MQLVGMGLDKEVLMAISLSRRRALKRVLLALFRETEAELQKGNAKERGIDSEDIYAGLILLVNTKKLGQKHCVVLKHHGTGKFKCWFGDGKARVIWANHIMKVLNDKPVVPLDVHTHYPMRKAQEQLMAAWAGEYPQRPKKKRAY